MMFAQKEDRTWVIGHDYNFNDTLFGRLQINFNESPPVVDYLIGNQNMNMFICNASISDTVGNLLFYSNGCDIANESGGIVLSGEDVNPGEYHTFLCEEQGRGYSAGFPALVILPLPDNDSLYYLFHMSIKYIPPPMEDAYVDRLLYSKIKAKGNERTVEMKNVPLILDSLATGELNAVKHANGKDWWIILPRRNSNQFYFFLFTQAGITEIHTQTIGDLPPADKDKEGYGQTTFSPQGDRMIRYFPYTPIMNYTFDRNTGYFTDYSTFLVDYGSDLALQGGCAISPSGRFLYIAALLQVYQFDLWAQDIGASKIKVAIWDGFKDPIAVGFLTSQLGPDCKIYILGGGDTRYYHIIHNPDEQGLACNFEQRGMVFPVPSGASIPYFPNYHLGTLDNPGSPCSVTVSIDSPIAGPREGFRIYPNPASEYLELEYQFVSEKPGRQLILFDVYGNEVNCITTPELLGRKTLRVGELSAGIYHYVVTGSSISGNVIVAH